MDKQEALEIICMIAEGLNPYVEKNPVKNPPERNPATIRAICTAISYLLSAKDRDELKDIYHGRGLSEIIESVNGPLQEHLKKSEKEFIGQVMDEADYVEEVAAKALNISREELRKKIVEYGMQDVVFVRTHLRDTIKSDEQLDVKLENIECLLIGEALGKCDQDKKQAADLLGITFRSMRYKVNKYKGKLNLPPDIKLLALLETKSYKELLQLIEYECLVRALEITNGKVEAAEFLGITFRSLRYRLEQHAL